MHYRWDPVYPGRGQRTGTANDSHLRASDAERNEVADRLSRHYADGRLDQAEFKTRLDRAMSATTRGDLGGLFDDLPPEATDQPPPPTRRRRLVPLAVILVAAALAVVASVPMMHVPWLLVAVFAVFVWSRVGRHHGRPRATRSTGSMPGRPPPRPPAQHGPGARPTRGIPALSGSVSSPTTRPAWEGPE